MFKASRIFSPAVASNAKRCVALMVGVTAMSLLAIETQAAEPARQITVDHQGIDLAQGENAANLYSKLRAAARAACIKPTNGQQNQVKRYRACYSQTLSQAVAQIDHANLTALLNSDKTVQHGAGSKRGS